MISYCSIKLKKRKIIASIFTRKKNKREWFLISQDIILPPFTFVFSSNQKGKKYLSFPINRQFPIRQFLPIHLFHHTCERKTKRKKTWMKIFVNAAWTECELHWSRYINYTALTKVKLTAVRKRGSSSA